MLLNFIPDSSPNYGMYSLWIYPRPQGPPRFLDSIVEEVVVARQRIFYGPRRWGVKLSWKAWVGSAPSGSSSFDRRIFFEKYQNYFTWIVIDSFSWHSYWHNKRLIKPWTVTSKAIGPNSTREPWPISGQLGPEALPQTCQTKTQGCRMIMRCND